MYKRQTFGSDPVVRVENAFLAGALAATAAMAVELALASRSSAAGPSAEGVLEAMTDLSFEP